MNAAYVRHALVTAFRAARFEPGATAAFDHSFEGFYRSFFASIVSLPFYVFLVIGQDRMLAAAVEQNANAASATPWDAGFILFEAAIYASDWLAMPLAMIVLVRILNVSQHYVPFVIAYNWGSVIVFVAFSLPVAAFYLGLTAPTALITLNYAAFAFMAAYRWRLARETLDITPLNAAAVVIVDVLLSIFIDAVAIKFGGATL